MEKEFIPYEQALALKQLGFNEPCLTYYEEDRYLKQVFILQYNKFELFSYKNLMFENDNTKEVSAPTFSQAFRWFREKYDYIGFIYQPNETGYWAYSLEDKAKYDTYEEAELECLNKLIEIVKR